MARKKYDFKFYDFVIMNNHFHLLIQTKKNCASISRIMQYIKGTSAQKYNLILGETGSFWNERFKSKIIEKSKIPWKYYLHAVFYLGYNPVLSGQVANPRDYYFSSFNKFFDKNYKPLLKMDNHDYCLAFGSTFNERKN
jgi:REP element-mobilizing transposase RayT